MLFLTIIAIFPHVQTHFLERVWKKFVLEAEDYRFCKTIPDEHMQTKQQHHQDRQRLHGQAEHHQHGLQKPRKCMTYVGDY